MKTNKYPTRIVLELTPLCNLSCHMCPRHYITEHDGYMSMELWTKLIDEIAEKSLDSIVIPFWRGESLMHEQFSDMIQYAIDKNIRVHLSTNGHYINEQTSELLSKAEFVTFSIHSKIGYNKAKEFVQTKSAIELNHGDENHFPTTQVSFVDCEKTAQQILPVVTATNDLDGFDSIRLYKEHTVEGSFGSAKENSVLSVALCDKERTFCPKLVHTLVIAADGSVSRCNHIWETEKSLNANDMSLEEIWSSDYFQALRKSYPDEKCAPCDQWTGHTQGESWRKENGQVKHIVF